MLEGLIPLLGLLIVLVLIFFVIKMVIEYFGGPPILVNIVGLILLLIWLIRALQVFGVKMP